MASAEFEQAVESVKGLTTDPGNEVACGCTACSSRRRPAT